MSRQNLFSWVDHSWLFEVDNNRSARLTTGFIDPSIGFGLDLIQHKLGDGKISDLEDLENRFFDQLFVSLQFFHGRLRESANNKVLVVLLIQNWVSHFLILLNLETAYLDWIDNSFFLFFNLGLFCLLMTITKLLFFIKLFLIYLFFFLFFSICYFFLSVFFQFIKVLFVFFPKFILCLGSFLPISLLRNNFILIGFKLIL